MPDDEFGDATDSEMVAEDWEHFRQGGRREKRRREEGEEEVLAEVLSQEERWREKRRCWQRSIFPAPPIQEDEGEDRGTA